MVPGNKLSVIIALIYRHAVGSTDETSLLRQLRQYMAAKSGWIWAHDFRTGESTVHQFNGFDGAYVESYVTHYAKLNPWLNDRGSFRSVSSTTSRTARPATSPSPTLCRTE